MQELVYEWCVCLCVHMYVRVSVCVCACAQVCDACMIASV